MLTKSSSGERVNMIRDANPLARDLLPGYLVEKLEVECGPLSRACFYLLQLPLRLFVWVALRPRAEQPGNLEQAEVDRVYTARAKTYDRTHHITTRGQDTAWRRFAAWVVVTLPQPVITVLDLCTGTGLTVKELARLLYLHGKRAQITGLDYNQSMLACANQAFGCASGTEGTQNGCEVRFVRGDATAFCSRHADDRSFAVLLPSSVDAVTQVFGIGGVADPVAVFDEALAVLRENGRYILVDMHRPIPELSGEYPLPGAWVKTSQFEAYTYLNTTVPLVLARLWAWRDTTLDFYIAPFMVLRESGQWYGFRIITRTVESERWWFGLPVMPVCRLVLEKVRITEDEYRSRHAILQQL